MAERWQQWMPFHIDRFRGSPEVQAMHPAARSGFLYLLASAWQTDDCSISSDPIDLATESGLGDELWAQYGPRILRKFELVDGRYRNPVLFQEWSDALSVYDKRKAGAVRTNSVRSPNAERTQSERNTDTVTVTGTTTGTEKKQRPSRDKRASNPVHSVFKGLILDAWKESGTPLEMPWDGAEGKQLGMLIGANPKLGPDGMRRLLQYRARSNGVNLAERPSKWLRSLTDYARGPLNEFKQPQGATNGNRNHGKTAGNIDALAEAERFARERHPEATDDFGGETAGTGDAGYASDLLEGSSGLLIEGH